jgi:hypothetical protein
MTIEFLHPTRSDQWLWDRAWGKGHGFLADVGQRASAVRLVAVACAPESIRRPTERDLAPECFDCAHQHGSCESRSHSDPQQPVRQAWYESHDIMTANHA